MATKNRFPDNKFNFLRFRKITGGTLSDLPITADDAIDIDATSPTIYPYYYGTTLLSDLTPAEIISVGTLVNATGGGAVTLPFSGTGVNLWVWFDDVASTKTEWDDPASSFNQGTIGGTGDLFLSPTAKTVNSRTGKFYITELPTVGKTLILS